MRKINHAALTVKKNGVKAVRDHKADLNKFRSQDETEKTRKMREYFRSNMYKSKP